MAYLFENNADTSIVGGITAGATSLTVTTGTGSLFPSPTGGDIAALTIVDTILGTLEIVHITARAGDVMTIVRGQEGTTPLAFGNGSKASHRVTAGTLEWLQSLANPVVGGYLELAPISGNAQIVTPGDAADVGLTIQGIAAQTADLQQWINSAAAVMASISPVGAMTIANAFQALRLRSTQAGTEAVPSITVGGSLHGFRLFGARFAVVVNNTDAAVFEEELIAPGSLDSLSVITKRLADLLYFPLGGGDMAGPLALEYADPTFDLVDTDGVAFPGYNRVRIANGSTSFSIELRDDSEAFLANFVNIPYSVAGATDIQLLIAGVLAASVAAVGAVSPAATTILTREKGDARFTGIAHSTDMGNPHAVSATQVSATGTWGNVQSAINALEIAANGGVQTVFGRAGTVIAVDGDYDAYYVNKGGATMAGQLTLPGGGSGLNAATVNDVDDVAGDLATHEALTSNPHSVTPAQIGAVATADLASAAQARAGTENSKWMSPLRVLQSIQENALNRLTSQALGAGVANVDFAIPAGADILVAGWGDINYVSGYINIQLGDSVGIETTGYLSQSFNSAATASALDGFRVTRGGTSATDWWGMMVFMRLTGNTWVELVGARGDLAVGGGGGKVMPGEVETLRFMSPGGNIKQGNVNVMWM
jgi:hypothetical protein